MWGWGCVFVSELLMGVPGCHPHAVFLSLGAVLSQLRGRCAAAAGGLQG